MIDHLKRFWKLILLVVLAALAYGWFAVWPAETQVATKQAEFAAALATRDTDTIRALLSDDYKDRWGWDGDELVLAYRDATRNFDNLTVDFDQTGSELAPPLATVTAHVRIGGSGNPVADTAVRYVNRLEAPFTFEWRKTSWLPWSWRIASIDHPELEVPSNYVPGDMTSIMLDF